MATPDPAAQLAAAIRAALAPAAAYLALVTRNNPYGSPAGLLGRPDVEAVLRDAFTAARERALEAVEEAWGEQPPAPLLADLLADVAAAWNEAALAHLRGDIRHAWQSVSLKQFIPGVTPPGAHPVAESAAARAQAVRDAVENFARRTGLRNSLSADVAGGFSRTLAGLDAAPPGMLKRWRAHVERPTCCWWCRKLNGVTIGLHESFAHHLAGPADLTGHGHLTQPPVLYHGWLQGPKLHPHCECWLEFVPAGAVSQEGAGQEIAVPGFLAAADIRALPEDRYQSVLAFLRAATHELGQALARLRELVRRG